MTSPFNHIPLDGYLANPDISADDVGFPFLALGGFVIPGILNELNASPSGTVGNVTIGTGAAFSSWTKYYTNDSDVNVALTAAANNRIDRIVLRYSEGDRTVRITKIIGTAAANPSPPALTDNDIPLAWVWVPNGFNPATDLVAAENIHDERIFRDTSATAFLYTNKNIMPNSEFLAFSRAVAGDDAPEYWRRTGPPTSLLSATRPSNQARGRSIRIQGNAAEGMTTTLAMASIVGKLTLKGTLNITSGSARVTVEGISKDFYRTGVDQEFVIRVSASAPITITIEGHGAGTDFKVSQLILAHGYIPGNLRPKHEIIMFDYAVVDANWTATAKSTGNTNIDLTTAFGGLIPDFIRGLIVKLRANDSGSAGGNAGLQLYHPNNTTTPISRLYLDGEPNDAVRETIGYVPASFLSTSATNFIVGVTATGALTLDATIEILGIIT